MSNDSDRRREIKRLFALRETEGLSFGELSDHSGIPIGTLRWWSHRLRHEEPDDDGFVDLGIITVGGSPSLDTPPVARLLHPSGLIVELHGELAGQVVSSVLQDALQWS